MSKFTRERKKRIFKREKAIKSLDLSIKKLEKMTEDVKKLYEEHPEFDGDFNKPENIELWKRYVKEYHDTLDEEFA